MNSLRKRYRMTTKYLPFSNMLSYILESTLPALHPLTLYSFARHTRDTRNASWCILIRNYFRAHLSKREGVRDAWTSQPRKRVVECVLREGKSWSLIWLLLLYLPGIAHGSVHDEIRRGMLYQARSCWKLRFAVCSSVRSGADINLTSYEVCLKSSANASAKQRQMTFVELNSYLAVTSPVARRKKWYKRQIKALLYDKYDKDHFKSHLLLLYLSI